MGRTPDDICVIVPAFNAAATVARAVRSALAEPQAAQVIVIDDGSTDGTSAAAAACDDGSGRLALRRLPASRGPAAARNLGLAEARTTWVCPLDSDDYFQPGRLGRLLRQAGGCDFVADDLLRAGEHTPDRIRHRLVGERLALPADLDFAAFVRGNISHPRRPRAELGFLKPLMRRRFLAAHGLAYDERLRLGEDFVLYASALALGARFRLVEPCGYVAVERPTSLSSRHGSAELAALLAAARGLASLPLDRRGRAALAAHGRHVAAKLALRRVLDAKRAGGWAAAGLALARAPQHLAYVLERGLAGVLAPDERARPQAAAGDGGDLSVSSTAA